MILKYCLVFVWAISFSSLCATFYPIDLEQQFKNSSGVIIGNYVEKNYKKLSENQVVTELTIEVEKFAGISQGSIVNHKTFKVLYLGGRWQGLKYEVSGAPVFKKGEKVALIIDQRDKGFWLNNFAMGKYTFFKEDGMEYLKSAVFPHHKNLGKISMKKFENDVENVFGTKSKKVNPDKFIVKTEVKKSSFKDLSRKKRGRKPASSSKKDSFFNASEMFWFVLILSFLGFISSSLARKN